MNTHPSSRASLKHSYWCMIVGTIVIAIWCRYIDPVINPDGVKYVLASEAILKGNLVEGLQAYKWPFYSLTVAFLSYLTPLDAEHTALVFNAAMRIIAGLAFIKLVYKFGATSTQLFIAALVFVFYPGLNEVQSMIIRDFAYLGCFMWMIVFFVQQISNPTRGNFLGFLIMGLLATAYRIEGLVYLIGLFVVYLLWGSVHKQWKKVGLVVVALLLPILVYGVLMWIYNGDLSNAWEILMRMLDRTKEELSIYIQALQPGVYRSALDKLFWSILLLMPIAKLLFNVVEVVTLGYVFILLFGVFYRPLIDSHQASNLLMLDAWKWTVGINLLVLVGFVLVKQIVTDRYPLSLALMLMLFIPFAVTALWQKIRDATPVYRRVFTGLMGFLLILNSAEGLDRFSDKGHLKEAGKWIATQEGAFKRSKVYSNNRIVDYYVGKPIVEQDNYYSAELVNSLVLTSRWKRLHFLAIVLDNDSSPGFYRSFRYRIGKEPERIFENRKGEKVLVYDFRGEEKKKYAY